MNVWPAMVNVPVRAPVVLAAALNATLPFPVPLAPDVIVSQPAFAVAVQVQPVAAETATFPLPPEPAIVEFVGAIE